jgi:YHS domain-containing protein
MDLGTATVLALAFLSVSTGVGIYVSRYKSGMVEMAGDMVGMTMGMVTGIAIGYFIGVSTDMFIGNLVGVTVGIIYGAGFGRMGGLMGILDGAGMGGFMGGMMGAMLGVMINVSSVAVWVTAGFVTAICLALYGGLIRYIQVSSDKQYARDPVCDMDVDVMTARFTSLYHDQTVYFCAPGCKRAFDKDPEHYLARSLRHEHASVQPSMPTAMQG